MPLVNVDNFPLCGVNKQIHAVGIFNSNELIALFTFITTSCRTILSSKSYRHILAGKEHSKCCRWHKFQEVIGYSRALAVYLQIKKYYYLSLE